MSKWQKKLNIVHFKERVPCPFCPEGSETYPSNLSLCRHVLKEHNWNKDFLKGFEILETHGAVMIVKKKRVKIKEGVRIDGSGRIC